MQEPEEFSIAETLKELRRQVVEDPGFFFETLENEAGQVLGIIFASSVMSADARKFGDLLHIDFTFGTNKFGFHLGMASGVGCEYETVPIAAALIFSLALTEMTWVMKQLVRIIGRPPEVAFTDGCIEEHQAIQSQCPGTILCLCMFHLFMQNLKDHLHKLLASSWHDFYACMWRSYYAETEELFLYHYEHAIDIVVAYLGLPVDVNITLVDGIIGKVTSWGDVISFQLENGTLKQVQRSELPKAVLLGRSEMKSKVPLVRALAYMHVQLFSERAKWASYCQRGFTLGQSASVRQEQLFSVLKNKNRGGWPKNATLTLCVKMLLERLRQIKVRIYWRLLRQNQRTLKTKVQTFCEINRNKSLFTSFTYNSQVQALLMRLSRSLNR